MATGDYEIGMTYHKNGRYFLAVGERTLVTMRDGEFQDSSPYTRYEPVRNFSVESLCDIWDVPISRLNELSDRYFTPTSCHDATPSYRTAQRRNMLREAPIRVIRLAS